jgi:ABC-type Zn uptake system ZnuABC Zn-binding protein ZnuA
MAASNELLQLLHETLGEKLLARIESGEASPQDFAQAIKFLKDNNIEAVPNGDNALSKLEQGLSKRLPFSNPDEPHQQH